VSPLLANIDLHELDRYMESKYLNLTYSQRGERRKKGKGNVLYVRYADDFVVLCNGTKAEAQAIKQELGEFLSTMGLTLSKEKTKVTHITEGFDFLGYRIIRSIGIGCLNRPSAVDRFLDFSSQSRFSHVWWPSIFNHTRGLLGHQRRPILVFTTH